MSKNDGVQHFVIMKTRIFLIILGFIQLVYCLQIPNISNDESYPVCPVSLFRQKRANMEYTRWRSNVATGPTEFIVKVLEDELPTSKPVVAVNIVPGTTLREKIIIGGAMVPPPSQTSEDQPKDYTRFVPPTTVSEATINGELYLAPAHPQKIINAQTLHAKRLIIEEPYPSINFAPAKHAQRDESPPASPQFVVRAQSPPSMLRQYAPVPPVFLNRRTTIMPLTPPSYPGSQISHTGGPSPMRSSPLPDILSPTRTVAHDQDDPIFQPIVDEEMDTKEIFVTRSTVRTTPSRSSPLPKLTTDPIPGDEDFGTTLRKDIEKENDISYHNMFYHEDFKDSDSRKKGDETAENEEEATKGSEENNVTKKDTELVEIMSDTRTETVTGEDHDYNDEVDDDEEKRERSDNSTPKMMALGEVAKDEQTTTYKIAKERADRGKEPKKVCSVRKLRQLNFNSPRTLPEIVAQLKTWAEESPVAKWVDITNGNYTAMENPIYMMIVDDPSSGQIVTAKQTVMVVAGIQGRDHHAVAAAMYVLYQLIERSDSHADLLSKYRFWIIPVFNPDGYDYSMTFPHRREWTKNLRQTWEACRVKEACGSCEEYGLRCTIQPCYGVHLDRNFEYQWIPTEELKAEHPCGTLYAGERQLSEAETRGLTQYLHGLHVHRAPIYYFIALKEGDVLGIMYPYSHTKKKRAYEHVYKQRASRAASAAYSISGRPYLAGQTSEFLPLYAGGIEDWVEGHLGIDNTYTIMLFRSSDSYNSKLITERVVQEAYAAMDTLLLHQNVPQEMRLVLRSVQYKTLPSQSLTLLAGLFSIGLQFISF